MVGFESLLSRSWKGFNLHYSLYQSDPLLQAQLLGYSCGGKPDSAMGRARCQITRARVRGRKFFQVRCMSWSYRNRGKEARTQRKTMERKAALIIMIEAVSGG